MFCRPGLSITPQNNRVSRSGRFTFFRWRFFYRFQRELIEKYPFFMLSASRTQLRIFHFLKFSWCCSLFWILQGKMHLKIDIENMRVEAIFYDFRPALNNWENCKTAWKHQDFRVFACFKVSIKLWLFNRKMLFLGSDPPFLPFFVL
jgi:hypothetical protein